MNAARHCLLLLGFLLVTTAHAQYQIKAGNFNPVYVAQDAAGAAATAAGPPVVASPVPTAHQFAAVGEVSAVAQYASGRLPANADGSVQLVRVSFGIGFATGLPRYSLGDEISPPLVEVDGVTPAAANYWRAEPVLPGAAGPQLALPVTVLSSNTASASVVVAEVPPALVAGVTLLGAKVAAINGTTVTLEASADQTLGSATTVNYTTQVLFPLTYVTVTAAATSSTAVTVTYPETAPPAALKVGALLLGQPVTQIVAADAAGGSVTATVTLAANANATITSATPGAITPATTYYYSVHAEKVYANQPGQVSITWITQSPDGAGNHATRTEIFAVSSTTARPIRTIFWTEGSFDGPAVQITDSRITTVNPAYYGGVPKAVAEEVGIPGSNPVTPRLTTLSFDKYNGIGQLHAYNVEGRILIEYLGNVRKGQDVYESIGTDVVDIKRVPVVSTPVVQLGREILPHDGDTALTAAPVLGGAQQSVNYYGTTVRPDGVSVYHAERTTSPENQPDDGTPASQDAFNKVVFYWLETAAFGIRWPKFQDRYWLRWSPELGDYAHYTVGAGGSTAETGLAFSGGQLPQIVFQDDSAQTEARIDLGTQRLYVTFTGADQRNRALLKFRSTDNVWYVNLYTQAEGRKLVQTSTSSTAATTLVTVPSTAQLTAGMSVTGPGISGTATIVQIVDGTHYRLSQTIADATADFTYGTPVVLSSTSSRTVVTHSIDPDFVYEEDQVWSKDGLFRGTILHKVDATHFILSRNLLAPFGYVADGTGLYDDHYPGGALYQSDWSLTTSSLAPNSVTVASTADLAAGMKVTGPGISGSSSIAAITDATHYVLADAIPDAKNNLTYALVLSSTSRTSYPPTTLTVASTAGLEVGMVVSGPGISGLQRIAQILNGTQLLLTGRIADGSAALTYTVEADADAPIQASATVGERLTPPAGHEAAGYISGGRGYYPAGYIDPFAAGVAAAKLGAIIPVNALPTDDVLTVRWFKQIPPPGGDFQALYVPGKTGRYTVVYPTSADAIVIAQGTGTGELPPAEAAGRIYYQNDPALPGYNPNEEHALMAGGKAYALREDLNVTSGDSYTSEPCVLLAYSDPADSRPAMHVWQVVRANATHGFEYAATAGTLLPKPHPLPLMPQPLEGTGVNRRARDFEVTGGDAPANPAVTDAPTYAGFTFQDRKGYTWVHRGPHGEGAPPLTMKLYYPSLAGFFVPGLGEPAVGTVLPFLRDAARSGETLDLSQSSAGQADEPLPIVYRPAWPENAPQLLVGESLTLAKYGLPQVRGQSSAQVCYQQSIATDTTGALTKSSVVLHDPTREKTVALDAAGVGLSALPAAIRTSSSQGRTCFQGLPPQLQLRCYLDPLRGTKGTLVLTGEFHDESTGEDYLDLNLFSAAEEALVKGLVPTGAADKARWDAAIDALNTRVQTWRPDPAHAGSFIVDSALNQDVGENELAVMSSAETAQDSYALTATGRGAGYVTMIFGNAANPDRQAADEPVQVKVLQVAQRLYSGDLKVRASSNPLDEQVTLRHSGDFAGRPEDYEFEWRWATGAASAPATYESVMTTRVGGAGTADWLLVSAPGALTPTASQYAAASSVTLPGSHTVHPADYTTADAAAGHPALVFKATTPLDFSPGMAPAGVPDRIVFSAKLGSYDGCVLYVNGRAVLGFNAPAQPLALSNAASGLTPLGQADAALKQFALPAGCFTDGINTLEVAVYTTADEAAQSTLGFALEAAQETDLVDSAITPGTEWQTPAAGDSNVAIVGGSAANPFGGPQFVLNDRWFTVRCKTRAGSGNVLGDGVYSRWTPPQFVEGWVKRVLAAINPFEQRVKDLYNNAVNTDVSVLTQAGARWEGDIALTLDNINDSGLIAIYETVLNRARSISIDAGANDPDSNNALLLAAGYLHDLYTLLGNEAYADAANPTISLDDQSTVTEVNTSRFAFEGQVASSLAEELALLRGRDNSVSPGVGTAPAYNRLYWNYTQGINSGEVIYAINYNIKEKVGSSTADGVIDAADAQRMFPQGHGDAYGHYLTALTGYYRLLHSTSFDWRPRAEAVTVLGQAVTVDFLDERKFAAAAGNVARTAAQIVALTHRQQYQDDPGAGWEQFRDTDGARGWGLDEWTSRSTQGALYHWAVANALVPDVDSAHTGVQTIDRTTVPEIAELAAAIDAFQTTIDNANAHLNPLGLSAGAIALDLDPSFLTPGSPVQGKSHYEQIYDRALRALLNTAGSFNQAAKMTRSLRLQQNQQDDYNTTIAQQETAYVNQLIDIFGRPYAGEIGAGKVFAQGYTGPDLVHWFIVDRPNGLNATDQTITITLDVPAQGQDFTGSSIDNILATLAPASGGSVSQTVTVQPSQYVQYNDVWKAGGLGSRAETGALQDALQDAQRTYLELSKAAGEFANTGYAFRRDVSVFKELVVSHRAIQSTVQDYQAKILSLEQLVNNLEIAATALETVAETAAATGAAVAEYFPHVVGLSTDATSPARGGALTAGIVAFGVAKAAALSTRVSGMVKQTSVIENEQELERLVTALEFTQEEVQAAYELDQLYRDYIGNGDELMLLTLAHQRALQNVSNVLAKGGRILAEREVFRQRAAAVIQGYRTNDVGFRLFRNEALEQYRSLFDLASRYSYLAAKSYDYETGLLGTAQGRTVFDRIVASRSLGDLTGGTPQSTTSTLGDAGLAGVMAQLQADFAVVEGRLGLNNPDQYGTVFSLRSELFRLLNDANSSEDDAAWQQTLEQHIVADLLTDADVVAHCRNLRKPDGTPVPGIILPFRSTIQHDKNFFDLNIAAGDHAFTPSNFATKIYSVGIALPGYVGMDAYAAGNMNSGQPASSDPNALSATPYVYLIPVGNDYMLAPPLGDTNTVRSWKVQDQALPLPYNLGANDFNETQFFNANGTLSEQPWIIRKHQAFRPVSDPSFFYSTVPQEFTNTRLIGRSVWNGQWKLVIPAYPMLHDEQAALNRFAASVKDVQLFLRTYSNSGN